MQGRRRPQAGRTTLGWRLLARAVGKTLIGAGVVVLLFVAYQLWGTGISEARSQDRLQRALEARIAATPTTTVTTPGAPPTTAVPLPPPPTGDAVAILRIPKIDVTKAVIEGVGVPDLKKGPGHYPGTPLPGQPGNTAIAGHRTTYGAPFLHLDELAPGDPIFVTTRTGAQLQYDVVETKVVKPSDVGVVADTPDNRLTLTTCHPRYSAAQRLVVVASLRGEAVEAPSAPAPAPPEGQDGSETIGITPGGEAAAGDASFGLGGDRGARVPALLWALATFWVGLAIWVVARGRRRLVKWAIYLVASPALAVVMFVWFQQVNRLLPSHI